MPVMLSEHEAGVIVEAWVVPASSRDRVGGVHAGAVRVQTSAPAEGGRANEAASRLVAAWMGGRRGRVLSGHTARRKRILVEGVTIAVARRRVSELRSDG